ncbi:Hint domain-containing protein [Roseovarius phycicola]|uniref:Hint domain-containing protein n=1 Tax=Roseovarius phycicola TaxID=3080976 RepID=A0ABZ2HKF9_9RHOB
MAWLGLRDNRGGWFRTDTDDFENEDVPITSARSTWLRRGTILIETRLSADTKPQTLFSFQRTWPKVGRFSVQALAHGGIVLVDAIGNDVRHATLPFDANGRVDVIRLSFSWDVAKSIATLTLEQPEAETITRAQLKDPVGLLEEDLDAAFANHHASELQEDVLFVGVSDQIEPVGPMPTLTSHVPILTPAGEMLASEVRRGDMVTTDAGETVPVLQVVRRTVPARGTFRPIRLRAPYFNLQRDIVVAPQQRLVMRGSQVEYMFGSEAVLVPARHLVNDSSAFVANGPNTVTYHHLLLPGHQSVQASGCPLESLYIGRMRRKPDALATSVLAEFDRARLPEHPKPIWPVLKPFEAVTLATMRAA